MSDGRPPTGWGSERGFTLIELLVAMAIGVVVVGGIMTFMIVSIDQGNAISSRSHAVQQAQAGLSQLTRDLSEAIGSPESVTVSETSSTASISFDIPNEASTDQPESVLWTCPYSSSPTVSSNGTCTRQLGGTSSPKIPEMTGIESAIFSPVSSSGTAVTVGSGGVSNPAYVGITLDITDLSQDSGTQTTPVTAMTNPIVVQSGVDLRNLP